MTTKRALLLLITIFASVSLVEAQSPAPSPSASPEASASPAKKRGRKKAEASPVTSPEATSANGCLSSGQKQIDDVGATPQASHPLVDEDLAAIRPSGHSGRRRESLIEVREDAQVFAQGLPQMRIVET